MRTRSELANKMATYRIEGRALPPELVEDTLEFLAPGLQPFAAVNQAAPAPKDSGFRFGRKSQVERMGVLPIMVDVADLALRFSTQDFMIFDGLRTQEEQAAYVKRGASKTMNSKHLKQADGYSHAFDAVPVDSKGIPRWDWNLIWAVAFAVDQAATQLGVANRIRWGGAWDRTLADFGGTPQAYQKEAELYSVRHPGKDFIDGPHFEWIG